MLSSAVGAVQTFIRGLGYQKRDHSSSLQEDVSLETTRLGYRGVELPIAPQATPGGSR